MCCRVDVCLLFMVMVMVGAPGLACTTDYQRGANDPNYGAPNALSGESPPGPSDVTRLEGGASQADAPLCVKDGKPLADAGAAASDGGACNVTFSKDVIGALGTSSPSCALPSCHGTLNQPLIDLNDPKKTWKNFATFPITQMGKYYINPCSVDDKQSAIACNLYATGSCGVHMPQGGQLGADAIATIETWLRCGSLDN